MLEVFTSLARWKKASYLEKKLLVLVYVLQRI